MQTPRALEDIKVADFTWVAVGPTTVNYLADHGATVIKVESHTRPDVCRVIAPYKGEPNIHNSGFFTHHNSSKYSFSLDVSKLEGKKVALKLIQWADIVTESMTPGAMKRLGLDYETVRKIKPDIIYYSTCMQGQFGPRCASPGYGQLCCALSGLYHSTGWQDRGPAPAEGAYVDYIAPRFGAIAILAALDYRRRTGKGQYIDLAQVETGVHFVAPIVMDYTVNKRLPERNGNRSASAAPHGAFPCKGEDRWIAIGIHSDKEWEALCKVINQPTWLRRFATFRSRKENEDELERLMVDCTIRYTAEELESALQAEGVPAGVVESNQDLFGDPQLEHRRHFNRFKHPSMGEYAHDNRAFRLSKTPNTQFRAPLIGEHNEYVCKDILGLSDEEIAKLLMHHTITTEEDLPGNW